MKRIALIMAAVPLWLVAMTASVSAQGILFVEDENQARRLPRPIIQPRNPQPQAYSIKGIEVNATIKDQIAETQISQTFLNPGSRVLNASFVFPLPPDAVVSELTLMVDGKEFEGKLLPKDEARQIYENYVRKSQDPALLEWMGSGMFKTSVFPIPAGAVRTVSIKYTQVLNKYDRMTDYLVPLATAKYTSKPIETLKFRVSVQSAGKLKTIYSPAYALNINRNGDHQATVTFEQQQTIPAADFRLLFDTSEQLIGASLLGSWPEEDLEGYFMLLSSPEFKAADEKPLPKDVVLVIDRSGSMSGKKIEQVKESLRFVVNQLNEGDRFNIVAYDNDIELFEPELQRYNNETRQRALGFVEGIYAGGSTNISEALSVAFKLLNESENPQYVIFLTDGLPTAGITDEAKIVAQSKQSNHSKARLLSLGVGYDVNSRLIDRLTNANRGQGEYVRPEENIEAYVGRLYQRISAPILTDISVEFIVDGRTASQGDIVNRIYPSDIPDLFQGEQLVLAGRYKGTGDVVVKITGRVGSESRTFEFPLSLAGKGAPTSHEFVEKIWASRRIGEIIDQIDLNGANSELIEELVGLSTKHGILTPYTSFLADDQAAAGLASNGAVRTEERLRRLQESDGLSGVAQRSNKADFKNAGQSVQSSPQPASASGVAGSGGAGLGGGGFGASPSGGRARGRRYSEELELAYRAGEAFGNTFYQDIDSDQTILADDVLCIGNTSLYKRANLWIAANAKEVDPKKLPKETRRVKRFSKEYFDLVAENTSEENAVFSRLADKQQLLIKLRGELVLIE